MSLGGPGPTTACAAIAADVDAFNLLLEMKLKRRRQQPNLPRTVTQLVAEDGSRVYVVGTAHFSDDSKRDVVKVSATARHSPDAGWCKLLCPALKGTSWQGPCARVCALQAICFNTLWSLGVARWASCLGAITASCVFPLDK